MWGGIHRPNICGEAHTGPYVWGDIHRPMSVRRHTQANICGEACAGPFGGLCVGVAWDSRHGDLGVCPVGHSCGRAQDSRRPTGGNHWWRTRILGVAGFSAFLPGGLCIWRCITGFSAWGSSVHLVGRHTQANIFPFMTYAFFRIHLRERVSNGPHHSACRH